MWFRRKSERPAAISEVHRSTLRGGNSGRRSACLCLRSAGVVAAGDCMPCGPDVAVAGRDAAARSLPGVLFQRGDIRGRHLLALHQHSWVRQRTCVDRALPDDLAGGDHGAVPRAAGLLHRPLVAGGGRRALVGRDAGCVAVHRMVARLVSVGVLLAVAGLLADRHVARGVCPDRRGLRHQRSCAGVRWSRDGTGPRQRVAAHRCRRSTGAAVDRRRRPGASRVDPGRRTAGDGRHPAGVGPAG